MIDARVEVRLTLEKIQAAMVQYMRSQVFPEIEQRIGEIVADIDVEALIRETVQRTYREELEKAVRLKVQGIVWHKRKQLEILVAKAIKEVTRRNPERSEAR